MKIKFTYLTALRSAQPLALIALPFGLSLGAMAADAPGNSQALTAKVQKLFAERCAACHKASANPNEETGPHLVDNLDSLKEDDINANKPEQSKLYTLLLQGKMPRVTAEEKAAGVKPKKLSAAECGLVLNWIKATAGSPAKLASADPPTEAGAPAEQPSPGVSTNTPPAPTNIHAPNQPSNSPVLVSTCEVSRCRESRVGYDTCGNACRYSVTIVRYRSRYSDGSTHTFTRIRRA